MALKNNAKNNGLDSPVGSFSPQLPGTPMNNEGKQTAMLDRLGTYSASQPLGRSAKLADKPKLSPPTAPCSAKKTLRDQQQRIDRFEILLRNVQVECNKYDTPEQKVSNYPTSREVWSEDDAVGFGRDGETPSPILRDLDYTCDMRTMQTPKFTRDHLKEKNALMRTPASFAPSGAWGHDNEPSNLLEIVEEERMAGVKVRTIAVAPIIANLHSPIEIARAAVATHDKSYTSVITQMNESLGYAPATPVIGAPVRGPGTSPSLLATAAFEGLDNEPESDSKDLEQNHDTYIELSNNDKKSVDQSPVYIELTDNIRGSSKDEYVELAQSQTQAEYIELPPASIQCGEYIEPDTAANSGEYIEPEQLVGTKNPIPRPEGSYLEMGEIRSGVSPHEAEYASCRDVSPEPAELDDSQEEADELPSPPDLAAIAASAQAERIHLLAATGDVTGIEALLAQGLSLNTPDASGRTPLMYALEYGQLTIAEWVLERCAAVNHRTLDGSTALHYSAFRGTVAAVKLLLAAGASRTLIDSEGRTPLHWAAHNPNVEVLALLAESAPQHELDATDAGGMTTLMWAAFYNRHKHVSLMMKLGVDCTCRDVDGKTALHWSAANGTSAKALAILLTYQNSFDIDASGKSVIHHAAEFDNKRAIKLIASKRPQAVHDTDAKGRTPVHWAAVCTNGVALAVLIKLGSHAIRRDVIGKTALDYAISLGFTPGIQLLASLHESCIKNPRLGPADGSTSLKAYDMPVPKGSQVPSDAVRTLFRMLSIGSYLGKFAHQGKGTAQQRYFWMDCFTGELCWAKSPEKLVKDVSKASSAYLVDVQDGPSAVVRERNDYDPAGKHAFAFTILAHNRRLDLYAPSKDHMRMWIDGLRCLRVFGKHLLVESADTSADTFARSMSN